MITDSHCHLADEMFAGDLDAVVLRARGAGVARALVILAAGDASEATQADRVAAIWPDVRFSIGVHPHVAHEFAANPLAAADTVRTQLAATPLARAIGETGLDYHYGFSPQPVQRDVFRAQIRLACELDLPIVIHTREAAEDTLAILREEGGGALRGVLHCFTGDGALAGAGLSLGLYISIAGIITFPKATALRDTIKDVPIDRLLVETDSPFLAPVPHRGKRNEPVHVVRVIEALAELRGLSSSTLAARTTANFHTLFRP